MTALSPDLDFSATARMVRYQDRGLEPAMADMGALEPEVAVGDGMTVF